MCDAIAREASKPVSFENPVFHDFMENHSDYVRVHIHLNGLLPQDPKENISGCNILGKRLLFGMFPFFDSNPDPYAIVETIAEDGGGSTDYFPIGTHQFRTLKNCSVPVWDSKCMLICKKSALKGIKITIMDENGIRGAKQLLMAKITQDEIPDAVSLAEPTWKHFQKTPEETDNGIENCIVDFSVMITNCSDRLVSEEDLKTAFTIDDNASKFGLEGYEYSEVVLTDKGRSPDEGDANALLQCWKNAESSNKAVLWVLGRNDCFMHPHVASQLFWGKENGYDLYVLNYKMNGHCRKKGWIADPHYNSHNPSGDFDIYISDIDQALEYINSSNTKYSKVLGYAHSTGGPILVNYLIERGDAAFDGFLFNSPFLDWGFVGGDFVELILEHTKLLEMARIMDKNYKVGVATTPEGVPPTKYMDKEIILSYWTGAIWSLYYFDWETRPLYSVPMTVGFAQGVTRVHTKIEAMRKKNKIVTTKPFLVITSRADDVLKASETLSRVDWIGPSRWEVELNDNGHDVFLSSDKTDNDMAITMCLAWMKNRKF